MVSPSNSRSIRGYDLTEKPRIKTLGFLVFLSRFLEPAFNNRLVAYRGCRRMDPSTATRMQIEAYRKMSGEERLQIALSLHELSCEISRESIRATCANATSEEVEAQLRQRIRLSYQLQCRINPIA